MNNEHITLEAIGRLDDAPDARFKAVMTSVVRHLHDIVREVEPTMAEWEQAIRFLTEVGHWSDDKRQEFIILSDTLGITMLVDAISNQKPEGATETTVLGPFFVENAKSFPYGANISESGDGEPTLVTGSVRGLDGEPVSEARLDVWQAGPDGFYDVQQPNKFPDGNLRGVFKTDETGRFAFCTVKPAPYPVPTDGPVGRMLLAAGRHAWRPAHLHFIITADGYQRVTTHLFVAGSEYLDGDVVQAVKESLIVDFTKCDDPEESARFNLPIPYFKLDHQFVLAPEI